MQIGKVKSKDVSILAVNFNLSETLAIQTKLNNICELNRRYITLGIHAKHYSDKENLEAIHIILEEYHEQLNDFKTLFGKILPDMTEGLNEQSRKLFEPDMPL